MQITGDYFERPVRVESYQIGASGHIRLSALLRMEQETGDEHMDALGLSYEKLIEDGVAILLTANRVQVKRLPVRNEELIVSTRTRGTFGVQMFRDFLFQSAGEVLVQIRQVTVCVDPATHKLLRPEALYQYGIFKRETLPREDRVPRMHPPENLPFLGDRPVRYSDLDMNRHLTNTIYGDIVEDFLPDAFRDYHFAQINYVAESKLGDSLHVSGGEKAGQFLLVGRNQKGIGFTALVSTEA